MTVLRILKLATLGAARRVGSFAVIRESEWRRRRLLILCYHGVSLDDEHECSDEHVSPDHLRRRFEILRDEGCAILPLGEAVERLARDELPRRSVVLTFDDGLYDFKARVCPLLLEFGYPATVYVSTFYCLNPLPVFDVAVDYVQTACSAKRASDACPTTPRRATALRAASAGSCVNEVTQPIRSTSCFTRYPRGWDSTGMGS